MTAEAAAPGVVRRLGRVDCAATIAAMRDFTAARTPDTPDEIWLCEHPAVYTQGIAGRPEHLRRPGAVPVLATDRGGQVTFHGPGQVVAYPLIDLKRLGLHVREYVYRLERSLLATLEHFGVTGHRVLGAPGVYVRLADPFGHAALGSARADRFDGLGKIAALGVKVSRHRSYHGVALNVAMDLTPFAGIDACGHAGLETVDLSTIGVSVGWDDVADTLAARLAGHLSA